MSVADVIKILKNTQHNGFPIIRHTEVNDEGQLVGLILRHQLLLLLEQRAMIEVDSAMLQLPLPERFIARDPRVTKEHVYLEHAMRVYHHCHYPHRRYLSSRAEAVDDLELDDILRVRNLCREWCHSTFVAFGVTDMFPFLSTFSFRFERTYPFMVSAEKP